MFVWGIRCKTSDCGYVRLKPVDWVPEPDQLPQFKGTTPRPFPTPFLFTCNNCKTRHEYTEDDIVALTIQGR